MLDRILKILNALGVGASARDCYYLLKYMRDTELRARNESIRQAGAPDGYPLPPPHMVYKILGRFDLDLYVQQGQVSARWIREVLEKNELPIESFESILDFGCGCGRVIRQWSAIPGARLHGTDHNRILIAWCRRRLTFGTFQRNAVAGPAGYPDECFDFIYALSVFTHLDEPLQRYWMDELVRILRPGGYLLFTTHGVSRLGELEERERARLEAGALVVMRGRYAGANYCSAYHPEPYVRRALCKRLRIVDSIPGGAADMNQDVWLVQKPDAAGRPMC